MHHCQRTVKTFKTLKSLENKHGTWKNLEIWKIQNKTLKSLDFMTATYHNFHNFGLFVIICFKNQNDIFITIFIISVCFENEFWKKCLLLFSSGSNSQVSCQYLFVIWTLKKAYYYLVVANSERVSVLFDMNCGKSVYYCIVLVVTLWESVSTYWLIWTLEKCLATTVQ